MNRTRPSGVARTMSGTIARTLARRLRSSRATSARARSRRDEVAVLGRVPVGVPPGSMERPASRTASRAASPRGAAPIRPAGCPRTERGSSAMGASEGRGSRVAVVIVGRRVYGRPLGRAGCGDRRRRGLRRLVAGGSVVDVVATGRRRDWSVPLAAPRRDGRRGGASGCAGGPRAHAMREVGADAHPRAADVVPHDRHDGDRVAAPTREVDDLGVEDDAGRPLPREEVAPDLAAEALEAALRVGHVAGDPGARDEAEDPTEQAPVERLAGAPVGAVGLDPAAERDVVVDERRREQRQLVGRRGHVGVGEDDEVAGRGEDARGDRRALARVRSAQHAEPRRLARGRRSPPDAPRRSPPCRRSSRRRRRGRPIARARRTSGRPGAGGPPRCR